MLSEFSHHLRLAESLPPLLPNVRIPEMEKNRSDEFERTSVLESEIRVGETLFPCLISFIRYQDRPIGHSFGCQRAQLHIEIFHPETSDRIGMYKGALTLERSQRDSPIQDGKVHQYWRIYTRRIDEQMRGAGLGTAGLRAFEEMSARFAETNPSLKAEWIEILTSLTSLTKMAISQKWLEDHHLDQYKKSSGPDFGYVPREGDEYNTRTVLRAGTAELNDIRLDSGIPQICLYKEIG